MSNLTKSFRDSFHELKDVKALGNDSNASCNCCRVRVLHPSGDGFH